MDGFAERIDVLSRYFEAAQTHVESFPDWESASARLVQEPRPSLVVTALDALSTGGVEGVLAADAQLKVMKLPSILIFHVKDIGEAEALHLMANFRAYLAWPTEPEHVLTCLNTVFPGIAAEPPEEEEEDDFSDFLNLEAELPLFEAEANFALTADPEITKELDAFLAFDDEPEPEEEPLPEPDPVDAFLDDNDDFLDELNQDYDVLSTHSSIPSPEQSDPFAETHASLLEITKRVPSLRSGRIDNLSVLRLLNYLSIQSRTGLLALRKGRQEVTVEFRDGLPVQSSESRQMEALKGAVAWDSGTFKFTDSRRIQGTTLPILPLLLDAIQRSLSVNQVAAELSKKSNKFPHFTDQFVSRSDEFRELQDVYTLISMCDGARPFSDLTLTAGADFDILFQSTLLALETDALCFLDTPGLAPVRIQYHHHTAKVDRLPASEPESAMLDAIDDALGSPATRPAPTQTILTPEQQAKLEELEIRLESWEKLDTYALFGVEEGCGEESIEDKYFELVRDHHPDRYASYGSREIKKVAEASFLILQDAYKTLLSREKNLANRPPSGSARPPSGPSRPISGVTRPKTGPTRPQTGPTRPASGTARPPSGVSRPVSGVSRPVSGVSRPPTGITSPTTQVTRPRTGVNRPRTNVTRPRTGVTRVTPPNEGSRVRVRAPSRIVEGSSNPRPPVMGQQRQRQRTRSRSVESPSVTPPDALPHSSTSDDADGFQRKRPRTRKVSEILGLGTEQPEAGASERPSSGVRKRPKTQRPERSPREHYKKGLQFLQNQDNERASKAFHYAVRGEPENGDYAAHLAWARFLCDTITSDQAKQELQEARGKTDGWVNANLFLGNLAKQQGQMDAAKSYYEKVLERKPNHTEATRELRLMSLRKEKKPSGLLGRFFGKKK